MTKLTTTSYAILGLLDLRPYTAYELASQSQRSLRFVWPTAQSRLYAEPKRLAAEGLIEISTEPAGPSRSRQVYRITSKGAAALRSWLKSDVRRPQIEMEILLRTLLADAGTAEDYLRALRQTREQASQLYDAGVEMLLGYAAGEVPFPERMHLNLVWIVLVRDLLNLVTAWAEFAEKEVQGWTGAAGPGQTDRARELLRAVLQGDQILSPSASRAISPG